MRRAQQEHPIWFIHTQEPPELLRINWYRWEFLRRNPEYRADYSGFIKRFSTWLGERCYWFETHSRLAVWTTRDEEHFYRTIFPVIAELCHKWKIGNLFSPDWKFDPKTGRRKFRGETLGLPTAISSELNWDLKHIRMLLENGFTGTASGKRCSNHLLLEFDLNWPLKDMLTYANRALRRGLENYRWELKGQQRRLRNTRRRFVDYDMHLYVWDLAYREKDAVAIAKILFPQELSYSAIQKVRDHLKTADKLVSGGYQDIR
jgi:hypothetical protein